MSYSSSAYGGNSTAVSSSVPLAPSTHFYGNSQVTPVAVHDVLRHFIINPRRNFIYYDDFNGGGQNNLMGWTSNTSGSGNISSSSVGVTSSGNAFGVARLGTGTTAGSLINIRQSNVGIVFSHVNVSFEMRVSLSQLSNSTDRFRVSLGCSDQNAVADDGVDSVLFRYSDDINGGNWVCVTRNNSAETTVNTSIAPTLNETFQLLRIDVDGSTTSPVARFYIDDALVGTITTNIPIGASRQTGLAFKIWKVTGTADVGVHLDYVYMIGTFLTPRG